VAGTGGGFTALDVHLVLLRRMADLQGPLVEDALRRLGSSRTEMRDANRRWNAAGFGRPGPLRHSRFARALGTPAVDRGVALAHAGLLRSCWPLDLWPGLWLQVLVDERDVVWHHGLTRAAGAPAAVLRRASDAQSWSCVLAECASAFDEVVFHDVGLTGHEAITCTAPDDDGRPGRWLMRSVWGLLQTVGPATDGAGSPAPGS
jgi:hypothetical protein